jgi:hypothetical protein
MLNFVAVPYDPTGSSNSKFVTVKETKITVPVTSSLLQKHKNSIYSVCITTITEA